MERSVFSVINQKIFRLASFAQDDIVTDFSCLARNDRLSRLLVNILLLTVGKYGHQRIVIQRKITSAHLLHDDPVKRVQLLVGKGNL